MKKANPHRDWPGLKSKTHQSGQAVVYGLFILVAGLASLFFFFNTGQLTREKSKLVNTADAVAYSAGVMHARALNFHAYVNRALMANEVLIAQMVSLSSWGQYVQTYAQNVTTVFPECLDSNGVGAAIGSFFNYEQNYALFCYLTAQDAQNSQGRISQIAAQVPGLTEEVVGLAEFYKEILQAAAKAMHEALPTVRNIVLKEVADQNYLNDGQVNVRSADLHSTIFSSLGITNPLDEWSNFSARYDGNNRGRMAEMARTAAYTDPFIRQRSWTSEALVASPSLICVLSGRKNEVRRRGGTELIGFDEWKAMDTQAAIRWRQAGKFPNLRCESTEIPIGYGEQEAHPSGNDPDDGSAGLGGARSETPETAFQAEVSSRDFFRYTGIPNFYDLSSSVLNDQNADKRNNPTLKFQVVLERERNQLSTSDGRSQVASSPTLNNYSSTMLNGRMYAMSTSEVYFERPSDVQANKFGEGLGRPREIGSLFNPYWQVRLAQ
jgi:hypothetical protein